ncbi:hypothetical protein Btru_077069 [Bulinus truncatus]|nr:hypothetical protein Btru_077069 [Bulinus truncatus]
MVAKTNGGQKAMMAKTNGGQIQGDQNQRWPKPMVAKTIGSQKPIMAKTNGGEMDILEQEASIPISGDNAPSPSTSQSGQGAIRTTYGFREYSTLRRLRPLFDQLRSVRILERLKPALGAETLFSAGFTHHQNKVKHGQGKPSETYLHKNNPLNSDEFDNRNRRSFDNSNSVPVCPVNASWTRLSTAIDQDGTTVNIVQGEDDCSTVQFFHIVTCLYQSCCVGIDSTRYHSKCKQEYSFAYALTYLPATPHQFERRMIQYESRCACYVSPVSPTPAYTGAR